MNRSLLDDRRVVLGGSALVALLLLALTWFVGVGPQLTRASELATQQTDAETQYATTQSKIAELAAKKDRMSAFEDALVVAQRGLPSNTALPAFTRQVTGDAQDAGVALNDVTISAPTGSDPTAANGGDGAAAAAPGPKMIGVTLTTKGTLRQQAAFVKALQDGDRRVLVGSTQITVGDGVVASVDSPNTMTTQVTIFTSG